MPPGTSTGLPAGAIGGRMLLVKDPALAPQKLEANPANARLSQGPVPAVRVERVRDAHGLHGFCSKAGPKPAGSPAAGDAMRVLGEKPGDFERLLDSLTPTWRPIRDYELMPAGRLARALGYPGRMEDDGREGKHERSRNVADSAAHGNLSLPTRIPIASDRSAGPPPSNRRAVAPPPQRLGEEGRLDSPFPLVGQGKTMPKAKRKHERSRNHADSTADNNSSVLLRIPTATDRLNREPEKPRRAVTISQSAGKPHDVTEKS
jgi:hypothetical protein